MADDDPEELPDGTEAGTVEAKSAQPWLNLIDQSRTAFEPYNDACDNIDKTFANLERLRRIDRSREMQLFWANLQVLGPSVYARTPVPVVMPKFKDRRPIPRTASELLERATIVSFDVGHVDRTLKLVRDDLVRLSRGVVWPRYETGKGSYGKKVCYDFKFRRDFLHDPARCWAEVDWVAAAAYLTKSEMRKRFKKHSGDAYKDAEYLVRKDSNDGKLAPRVKAKVWELWSKSGDKVVWVAEGGEKVLEEAKPHLTLEEFFPAPEPAYGTRQPESLIPVPDVLQYKDQLEEINELTARIAALSEAVQVRGFYPAGAGEIGDAIETAVKARNNNAMLIPVANWAMMGNGDASNMVLWWPIEAISATIAQLIELRRQLIQDVYEISGISDILRGQTDPNETLGAQELKAQTGSTRVRSKQEEIVRLARDLTRNSAEIMAEEFDQGTLLAMTQMELPTDADIAKQVKALTLQGQRMKAAVEAEMAKPEIQQQAQQNPEEAQKAMQMAEQQAQQMQGQIQKLQGTVTIDQVMKFLRDEKLRPFVLDIETDSTITPDENAQKQRMTEYVTAMGGLLREAIPAVQQVPQIAPMMGEIIKKANATFRMGREFEQVVEEFTDQMKQLASQPKGPDPEQVKAQAEAEAQKAQQAIDGQKAQAETVKAQAEAKKIEGEAAEKAANAQRTMVENAERAQALQAKDAKDKQDLADKAELAKLQRTVQWEKHQYDMRLMGAKIEQTETQTDATIATTEAGIEATSAGVEANERKTEAGIAATQAKAEQPQAGA